MSPKNNYKFYQLIEWGVAIGACAWLVWKLATYEDYAALGECLRGMGWQQWLAIGVCVALMPVNMALEAWRWKTLMDGQWTMDNGQWTMPFAEAHRQVYYSKLAGLITPWRLGEYPSRAILMAREMENGKWKMENGERTMDNGKWTMENDKALWAKVLSMGAVGSATMTAAIVLAGLVGIAFSPSVLELLGGSYLYAVGAVMVVLMALMALMPKMLKKWAEVNNDLLIRSVGQSLVRLLCWCVQLALVLYALGAVTGYGLWVTGSLCFVYYLLVTVTPNVPIVEVGVRGAWAVVVFGTMNAALAGVILWAINTLLPCVAWFFIRKKQK